MADGCHFHPGRFTKCIFTLIKADYQDYRCLLFLRIFNYIVYLSVFFNTPDRLNYGSTCRRHSLLITERVNNYFNFDGLPVIDWIGKLLIKYHLGGWIMLMNILVYLSDKVDIVSVDTDLIVCLFILIPEKTYGSFSKVTILF